MLLLIFFYKSLYLIIINLNIKLLFYPIGIYWSIWIVAIIYTLLKIAYYDINFLFKNFIYYFNFSKTFSEIFCYVVYINKLTIIFSIIYDFIFNSSLYILVFKLKRFFFLITILIFIITV